MPSEARREGREAALHSGQNVRYRLELMDSLNGLQAFVHAAEARSFARAARALGLTASGVGKSIARLEAELGVQLLSRTTRRVSLTDDGVVFLEHCRRILDELELARSSVSNRRGAVRGRLRVSLPSTLGKNVIVPRLPELLRRHPELTLDMQLSDRWVNLVEDAVDVALRIGVLNDSSLVARTIGKQQVISVAAPGYLRGKTLATHADLAWHACLTFRLPTSGRERPWRFQDEAEAVELRPRARLILDDGEALVEAARAGLGVTQVPSYMAAAAIADGSLLEVLADQRPPPDPLHAVHAGRRNSRPAVRAFIDFIAAIPELRGPGARAARA